MRPGFLNTCLVSLYFLITSAASPRDKYRDRDSNEHLPEVVKSVSTDLSKEPTCDELRAMWRFSKRQSRAAENTNEIPTYRDPFAYNVWEDHASLRSVGGGKMRRPLVYGRLVHNIQRPRVQDTTPERMRAFEEVARLFGTSVHVPKVHGRRRPTAVRVVGGQNGVSHPHPNQQTGSFQHLKELIQSERARELHEQKMSDAALHYQRMVEGPPGQRDRDREDLNFKTGRSRGHLEGVINFPDILAPSKYENDLYTNLNYMQRSYPDLMSVAGMLPGPGRRTNVPQLQTALELPSRRDLTLYPQKPFYLLLSALSNLRKNPSIRGVYEGKRNREDKLEEVGDRFESQQNNPVAENVEFATTPANDRDFLEDLEKNKTLAEKAKNHNSEVNEDKETLKNDVVDSVDGKAKIFQDNEEDQRKSLGCENNSCMAKKEIEPEELEQNIIANIVKKMGKYGVKKENNTFFITGKTNASESQEIFNTNQEKGNLIKKVNTEPMKLQENHQQIERKHSQFKNLFNHSSNKMLKHSINQFWINPSQYETSFNDLKTSKSVGSNNFGNTGFFQTELNRKKLFNINMKKNTKYNQYKIEYFKENREQEGSRLGDSIKMANHWYDYGSLSNKNIPSKGPQGIVTHENNFTNKNKNLNLNEVEQNTKLSGRKYPSTLDLKFNADEFVGKNGTQLENSQEKDIRGRENHQQNKTIYDFKKYGEMIINNALKKNEGLSTLKDMEKMKKTQTKEDITVDSQDLSTIELELKELVTAHDSEEKGQQENNQYQAFHAELEGHLGQNSKRSRFNRSFWIQGSPSTDETDGFQKSPQQEMATIFENKDKENFLNLLKDIQKNIQKKMEVKKIFSNSVKKPGHLIVSNNEEQIKRDFILSSQQPNFTTQDLNKHQQNFVQQGSKETQSNQEEDRFIREKLQNEKKIDDLMSEVVSNGSFKDKIMKSVLRGVRTVRDVISQNTELSSQVSSRERIDMSESKLKKEAMKNKVIEKEKGDQRVVYQNNLKLALDSKSNTTTQENYGKAFKATSHLNKILRDSSKSQNKNSQKYFLSSIFTNPKMYAKQRDKFVQNDLKITESEHRANEKQEDPIQSSGSTSFHQILSHDLWVTNQGMKLRSKIGFHVREADQNTNYQILPESKTRKTYQSLKGSSVPEDLKSLKKVDLNAQDVHPENQYNYFQKAAEKNARDHSVPKYRDVPNELKDHSSDKSELKGSMGLPEKKIQDFPEKKQISSLDNEQYPGKSCKRELGGLDEN